MQIFIFHIINYFFDKDYFFIVMNMLNYSGVNLEDKNENEN